MDLDSVVDDLYGLPLGEFTPARNDLAKQAQVDGDRELAKQIKALTKPTTSAWLVNRLARKHADEVEPLIELGRELRDASASLSADELRALTRQRHQVVHALVQQTRQLGLREGVKASDAVAEEVRQSLEASLSDPDAADAVLHGRLVHALRYAGFGELSGNVAPRPRRAESEDAAAEVSDLAAQRRRHAERQLKQTVRELATAEAATEKSRHAAKMSAHRREAAEQRVERLRAELEEAEQAAKTAAEAARADRDRLGETEADLQRAQQAHDRATADLDALSD